MEEMKGRPGWEKFMDTVTRKFVASGGTLVSGLLGTGALLYGGVPGLGKFYSETAAGWHEVNERNTSSLELKGGLDTFALRLSGTLASLAEAGTWRGAEGC